MEKKRYLGQYSGGDKIEETSLDEDRFVSLVFDEGVVSTLFGTPKAGKTNLAVVFMEMLVQLGYTVYTNINFFQFSQIKEAIAKHKLAKGVYYHKKPDEIHIVTSMSEILIGLLTTEKNVVILDETGIFGSSTAATSKKVRSLKELTFIIRHLSSAIMFLAQSKGSIIPDLRSTLTEFEMRIRMISKWDRMFTVATAVRRMNDITGEEETVFEVAEGDEFHEVPQTMYPFDSKFLPVFDIDIDLTEALKRLGKYNSLDVMEVGAGIVKELAKETQELRDAKKKRQEKKIVKKKEPSTSTKNAVRSELETSNLTLRDVAKKYKTSYDNVKDIHHRMLKDRGEM